MFSLLSSSKKRYLIAICKLGLDANPVKSITVASFLNVKRSSACKMINSLSEDGLIEKEHDGAIKFTDQGLRIANQLYASYILLHSYFQNVLQLTEKNANHDTLILCVSFPMNV